MNPLTLLETRLWRLGHSDVTVQSVLTAILVLVVALVISKAVRAGLDRLRRQVSPTGAPPLYVASQVSRYVIVFIGIVAAASVLGLDLSSISLFAGALGVGIGFGLQDIVRDFISGLVLMFDRSVDVGDFIELDDGTAGEVQSVGARATTIITNDNVNVLVPNSAFVRGRLTNWTRNRATRRIHVPFAVAFGSSKEKVREAALDAARAVPFTFANDGARRTQCWLVGYGDSAMKFELVVWPTLEAVKRPGSMMAAYYWAIDDALREHGIEIPYPQTDLRVRSLFDREGDEGLAAWRGEKATHPHEAPPAPHRTVNDAAEEIEAEEAGGGASRTATSS